MYTAILCFLSVLLATPSLLIAREYKPGMGIALAAEGAVAGRFTTALDLFEDHIYECAKNESMVNFGIEYGHLADRPITKASASFEQHIDNLEILAGIKLSDDSQTRKLHVTDFLRAAYALEHSRRKLVFGLFGSVKQSYVGAHAYFQERLFNGEKAQFFYDGAGELTRYWWRGRGLGVLFGCTHALRCKVKDSHFSFGIDSKLYLADEIYSRIKIGLETKKLAEIEESEMPSCHRLFVGFTQQWKQTKFSVRLGVDVRSFARDRDETPFNVGVH